MKELTLFNNAEFFSVSLQRLTQKSAYKKEHFKHITETVLMPCNSSTNALLIDFRRSGVRSPESLARRFASCDLSEQCHAATSDGYYFLLDTQSSYLYTLEISTRTLEVSRLPSSWSSNYMRTRQEAAPLRGLITARLSTARQLTLIDYDDEKNIMIEELKSITEQYKQMQAELETLHIENKQLREENELLAEESDSEIVSERVAVQSELAIESVIEEEEEQHTENDAQTLEIPTIDSYKQSWVAIKDLMTEIAESHSQAEIEQKTKKLRNGFRWFVNWKDPIELEMAFTAMTARPERALSTIRNAIEQYEESINKSVKVRV